MVVRSFGRLGQRETHVHGPEADAVQIPRHPAFRRQDEDRRRVRELLLLLVVAIMKADLLRQLLRVAVVVGTENASPARAGRRLLR